MSVTLKPGEYYVGDLCYAIPEHEWSSFMKNFDFDARFGHFEYGGHTVWYSFTAHGDGCYSDNYGNEYGVDAGLIGICSTAICDPKELKATTDMKLGCVWKFDHNIECCSDEGVIMIGNITIDTDPSVEVNLSDL